MRGSLDQVCNLCVQNNIVMIRLEIGMRLADDWFMDQLLTDLQQFYLDGITTVQPQVLHDRHHALNPLFSKIVVALKSTPALQGVYV